MPGELKRRNIGDTHVQSWLALDQELLKGQGQRIVESEAPRCLRRQVRLLAKRSDTADERSIARDYGP